MQFFFQTTNHRRVVQHFVDFGLGGQRLGTGGKTQRGTGFFGVFRTWCNATNDRSAAIADQGRLQQTGQFTVPKPNVGIFFPLVGGQRLNHPGQRQQTLHLTTKYN